MRLPSSRMNKRCQSRFLVYSNFFGHKTEVESVLQHTTVASHEVALLKRYTRSVRMRGLGRG
jgi:hypothetical protein